MIITSEQLSAMEKFYRTTLVNSLPGYRSLHMVGTVSTEGNNNIALFNSVFHLGANPALLGMVCRPDTPDHDTLKNILATREYTLNNVLPGWFEDAHQTSASYPTGVSEFEACGFTPCHTNGVKAPFIKESSIKIALKLVDAVPMDINSTTIVAGQITHILIDDHLIEQDGYVDHVKAGTVTVAGLDSYFTADPLARLAYAKPGQQSVKLNLK